MTKNELFLELAKPDEHGKSRWVLKTEFTGKYSELYFENGASWARKESTLARQFILEFNKSLTPGNRVDAIRLNGFNTSDENGFMQTISSSIKKEIKAKRCVVLGTSNPEVDHKNGMKNEARVMKGEGQDISDFQPLSKAANDAKRQFCKECRRTGIRYDAKKLGYPMSYYEGGSTHKGQEKDCVGCFWFDPIEFRKHLVKK